MARYCQVTGKKPRSGNSISHSNIKTKRRFEPNLMNKRVWLDSEQRFVRLQVSARGMKVIQKRGVERVIAEMRKRGEKV